MIFDAGAKGVIIEIKKNLYLSFHVGRWLVDGALRPRLYSPP